MIKYILHAYVIYQIYFINLYLKIIYIKLFFYNYSLWLCYLLHGIGPNIIQGLTRCQGDDSCETCSSFIFEAMDKIRTICPFFC
ncbi:hypothetical protein IEQ34_016367 [Dendrobium chrysotoxum]|uniref:Uncharacterized protein n=1 Tax=Dendrobium chrysotoxum TaxID=161865 RepID=A0AAV7GGB4_DENCH|nr:hypothetical protein IEQ34_016367 [Dendrobium chrysotoxum]